MLWSLPAFTCGKARPVMITVSVFVHPFAPVAVAMYCVLPAATAKATPSRMLLFQTTVPLLTAVRVVLALVQSAASTPALTLGRPRMLIVVVSFEAPHWLKATYTNVTVDGSFTLAL